MCVLTRPLDPTTVLMTGLQAQGEGRESERQACRPTTYRQAHSIGPVYILYDGMCMYVPGSWGGADAACLHH